MADYKESIRYTMKYNALDKFWYVCESGIALGYESKSEEAARKYCARLNNLVNV